jgi:hypothetical protein
MFTKLRHLMARFLSLALHQEHFLRRKKQSHRQFSHQVTESLFSNL